MWRNWVPITQDFSVLVLKIVHEFIILKIKKSLIEKALIPLS